MDIVSSVGSVIQIFHSCLKIYADIKSILERDVSIRANAAILEAEQYRLQKLSEFLGDTSDPTTDRLCLQLLAPIEDDLKEIRALITRHQKPGGSKTDGLDQQEVKAASPKPTFRQRNIVLSLKRRGHSITWMAADKEQLVALINRLHMMIDTLSMLVTNARRERIECQALSTSIATNDVSELEALQDAAHPQYPTIAQGAAIKALTLRARGELPNDCDDENHISFKVDVKSLSWFNASQEPLPSSPFYKVDVEKVAQQERAAGILDRSTTHGYVSNPTEDKVSVLVEWRVGFRSGESTDEFVCRLDYLVNILQRMSTTTPGTSHLSKKYMNFGVLECVGWTTISNDFEAIGLIFLCPTTPSLQPVSLNDWIRDVRKERKGLPPALGTRFDIAHGLALSLFNLVSVGWTHKELRSHNVLFFDRTSPTPRLYLSGFTYARPVSSLKDDLSVLKDDPVYQLYRPSQKLLRQHKLSEVVQPPTTQTDSASNDTPPAKWTSAKDIYGLGIILLEIGHWKTVASLKGNSPMPEFLARDLPRFVQDLSYRMGDIYCSVVSKCLYLGSWVDDDQQMIEELAGIVQSLAQCTA